jgi:hypothetical protein
MFTIHGNSFIGTASSEAPRKNSQVLATAAGNITFVFYPLQFADENIGTANGVLVNFTVANFPVEADSQLIYVDGVLQTEGIEYTFVDATGVATFAVAPVSGAVTATYRGTLSKVVAATLGQEIEIDGSCTSITSASGVIIS